MVPRERIELSRSQASRDFESRASTSSAIWASSIRPNLLDLNSKDSRGIKTLQYFTEEIGSNKIRVRLSQMISEDSEVALQNLSALLTEAQEIFFDFKGVQGINSLGIRAWVVFIRKLKDKKTYYEECPPVIINQINMISNFRGSSEILSFYTNYVCSCQKNKSLLILKESLKNAEGKYDVPQAPQCPCGKETMETEEIEDEYLAFLNP